MEHENVEENTSDAPQFSHIFCTDCIWNGFRVATQYGLDMQNRHWQLLSDYDQLQKHAQEFHAGLNQQLCDAENAIDRLNADNERLASVEMRLASANERARNVLQNALQQGQLDTEMLQHVLQLLRGGDIPLDHEDTDPGPLRLEIVPLASNPKRLRHQYIRPQVDTTSRYELDGSAPHTQTAESSSTLATSGTYKSNV